MPLPTRDNANIHALSGIRNHDPSVRAGEDIPCLRPHSHCDGRNRDYLRIIHLEFWIETSDQLLCTIYINVMCFLTICWLKCCVLGVVPVIYACSLPGRQDSRIALTEIGICRSLRRLPKQTRLHLDVTRQHTHCVINVSEFSKSSGCR
jgi:hypothetical protein